MRKAAEAEAAEVVTVAVVGMLPVRALTHLQATPEARMQPPKDRAADMGQAQQAAQQRQAGRSHLRHLAIRGGRFGPRRRALLPPRRLPHQGRLLLSAVTQHQLRLPSATGQTTRIANLDQQHGRDNRKEMALVHFEPRKQ